MVNENQEAAKQVKGAAPKQGYILLIDDEAVIREIGCEMLESLGFICIPAKNGEEGIKLYKQNKDKIVLVMLDIEMPGISGDIVYEILKKLNPSIKILLISGYAKGYLEAKYFKRKINPAMFMSKPFQLNQLSQKLASIMGDST